MGCESCKQKGKSKINWMTIIAFEVFIVSIYGHVELVKVISQLLSRLF
jgi:hypothetical protein